MKMKLLIAAVVIAVPLARGGGRNVLVAVGSLGSVSGELVAVSDTAIFVATSDDLVEMVPIRQIKWVSLREENHTGAPAAIGLVIGGILGGVIASAMAENDPNENYFMELTPKTEAALIGAGVGGLLGLGVGYAAGSSSSQKAENVAPGDPDFRQVLKNAARNPSGQRVGS